LDVVAAHPEEFSVVGLSANSKMESLAQQIRKFHPTVVAVGSEEAAKELQSFLGNDLPKELFTGREGLTELARLPEATHVVVATVGAIGTLPTLEALNAGKYVALANKEALVMGGDLVMKAAHGDEKRLLPVDSEHSAIFQCLSDHPAHEVSRIWLTGSGGPFRSWSKERIEKATVKEALNHPNWEMGNKITIDSATLMNKGLEVIEGMHLFDMNVDRIQVVIHPQSIVHSLVEFRDTSVLAQLGLPDMRLPIQYALSYPERWDAEFPSLNLFEIGTLTFEEADLDRFPCLRLAYEAARAGGTAPAVLSVANEEAVYAFLKGKIAFSDIYATIDTVLQSLPVESVTSVEQILDLEDTVRRETRKALQEQS